MLEVDDILSAYDNMGLTPVLVVLSGSHSFGHFDGERDYDYFGYHDEETEKSPISIKSSIDTEKFGIITIQSYPISDVIHMILDQSDPTQSHYILANWLWDTPVYETEKAVSKREHEIRSLLLSQRDVILQSLEKSSEMFNGRNTMTTKLYSRAKRIQFTAMHLRNTGEFNCDFQFLKETYGSKIGEHSV